MAKQYRPAHLPEFQIFSTRQQAKFAYPFLAKCFALNQWTTSVSGRLHPNWLIDTLTY